MKFCIWQTSYSVETYFDTVILLLQNLDSEKEKELERQARIEASLREREREVQKARSEQTKEIDREREQHKREEAIQNFKALLSDMVYITLPSHPSVVLDIKDLLYYLVSENFHI